jgi:short-subunit dehydrogenase involved in D-alanine esterification of teichoic acids
MLRPQVPIFSVEMKYCNQQKPNAKDTRQFAAKLRNRFPKLNVLVNNAGIQRVEDLKSGEMADAEAAIETNLLGPMRLTAALIVHLTEQPYAAILNVTSALAMLPAAMMASCCASKAAIHSYTQSLRYQLRNTPVQVIELVPPWVHSGNNDAWIRDSTGNWNATTQTITVKPHTVHPDRVGAKQLHYEHRRLRDTRRSRKYRGIDDLQRCARVPAAHGEIQFRIQHPDEGLRRILGPEHRLLGTAG